MSDIKLHDIQKESQREYRIQTMDGRTVCNIVILNPVTLFCGAGHAFHRVWDGRKCYLCPVPGVVKDPVSLEIIGYCTVSWIPKDAENPVQF